MFKQMVESLEKANVLAKLNKGELSCPKCGGAAGDLPENWDKLMICPSCGTGTSLSEWA